MADSNPAERLSSFLETVGPSLAFETLSELLPDAAVFVVDGQRKILHWSAGAERVLGFRREEAVWRLCLASIRCRSCMLGCGVEKHSSINGFPLDLYRADDRWMPMKKYARGFFDAEGGFAGGIEALIGRAPALRRPGRGCMEPGVEAGTTGARRTPGSSR